MPKKPSNSDDKKRFHVLSCMVLTDQENKKSRQFAFVDFDSPEAAKFCINSWNNTSMTKYPNRLQVTPFDNDHQKMS